MVETTKRCDKRAQEALTAMTAGYKALRRKTDPR